VIEHSILAEFRVSLSINFKDDLYSARMLDNILRELSESKKKVVKFRELINILSRYSHCLILMPGPSLKSLVSKFKIFDDRIVIVVDSAVDFIVSNDLVKYVKSSILNILVTDLDADINCLVEYCREVSPVCIVHAHGANIERLHYVKNIECSALCGTCQVAAPFLNFVEYCPGFTDGDRSIYIAHMAGLQVHMLGFDPEADISLSHKVVNEVKKAKLRFCRSVYDELRMLGLRTFCL